MLLVHLCTNLEVWSCEIAVFFKASGKVMLNCSTFMFKLEEMFNGNFAYNEHHVCNLPEDGTCAFQNM